MEYKLLPTKTPCWNEHQMEVLCFSEEKAHERVHALIPLGRWIPAEDIKHHYQYTENGKTQIFTAVALPSLSKTSLKAQPTTVSRTGLYQARS